MVTFREKRTITFCTVSEILQDLVIGVVSTICFPLPLPFRHPALQTYSYEKLKRGLSPPPPPPCCWSPEEVVRRHKWPRYELPAQRFPAGSHMNMHMYSWIHNTGKIQLWDDKSVLFLLVSNSYAKIVRTDSSAIRSWHSKCETRTFWDFERVEICPRMTIFKSKLQSQARENVFHWFIVMF